MFFLCVNPEREDGEAGKWCFAQFTPRFDRESPLFPFWFGELDKKLSAFGLVSETVALLSKVWCSENSMALLTRESINLRV